MTLSVLQDPAIIPLILLLMSILIQKTKITFALFALVINLVTKELRKSRIIWRQYISQDISSILVKFVLRHFLVKMLMLFTIQ